MFEFFDFISSLDLKSWQIAIVVMVLSLLAISVFIRSVQNSDNGQKANEKNRDEELLDERRKNRQYERTIEKLNKEIKRLKYENYKIKEEYKKNLKSTKEEYNKKITNFDNTYTSSMLERQEEYDKKLERLDEEYMQKILKRK